MAQMSTGLRKSLFNTSPFKTLMDGGFLLLYSGTVPVTADDALSGNTLLAKLTKDGDDVTGLTFATATSDTISKTTAEVWRDLSVVAGTLSFYRFITAAEYTAVTDTGPSSTTYERVQGSIGLAGTGADLQMKTSITLTGGAAQDVDFFSFRLLP